ncbi:MAG: hypothetical protein Q9202_007261 [Teloschistes flavicans]
MTYAAQVSYHQRLIIAIETLFKALSLISFGLRLWARHISKAKLWWDDYIMGLALRIRALKVNPQIFASMPGVVGLIALHYGLGSHFAHVSASDREVFLILFYAFQLSYVTTLPLVKISVLLFYHRIFPQKSFRRVTNIMGVILVLFLLSSWLVTGLQCLPIHSFWQPDIPRTCIKQSSYYLATGSLNLILDVIVVLMPIPLLVKLQLPKPQKIGVIVLFLSGGLVIGVALGRIIATTQVDPRDITWTNVAPGIWSSAEAEFLVISGNLPLMKPLFLRAVTLLGERHLRYRISNHEQSSDIFELSKSASRIKGSHTDTKIGKWESTERSVIAQGGVGNNIGGGVGGGGLRDPIPSDRILVEMDLEQNVISLGTVMPVQPRES